MIETTMLFPVIITTMLVSWWVAEVVEGTVSVKTTIGAVGYSGVSWLLWHIEPYDSFIAWLN